MQPAATHPLLGSRRHLLADRTPAGHQDDRSRAEERGDRLGRNLVTPHHEDLPGGVGMSGAQRDRVGSGLQIQLQLLGVAGRLLVQQHDVDSEAARAPELERMHYLTHQGHVGDVPDAHHQNRQVT